MTRIIALLAICCTLVLSCEPEDKKPQPRVPEAPNLLAAIEITQNTVHLNWNDNSDNEEGFQLEMATSGVWHEHTIVNADVTEELVDGLGAGIEFQFRVYAFNNAGNSAYSNTITVTTLTNNPPPAPTNVQATALVPTVVRVTWNDTAPNPVIFVIDRRGTSDSWIRVGEAVDNATVFNDSTCAASTSYYYRVGALAGSLLTMSVDSAQVTTPAPGAPLPPSNLENEIVVGIGVRLTWTDNSLDEDEFEIQRGLFGQQLHTIGTVAANITEYTDTLGVNVAVYNYRVRATNSEGNSGWSNIAEADYRYCSNGTVPICLSNYWTYEVDPASGPIYQVRRRIAQVEYPGGIDYYLVVQDSGAGWEFQDTLHYWRNFNAGLYQDEFPLDETPAEALLRYPSSAGFWNYDGDSVIVTTSSIQVQIGDTTYTGVRVYQRFERETNHSIKYYLRANDVGIIKEEEIVGSSIQTTRTLIDRDIRN